MRPPHGLAFICGSMSGWLYYIG